MSEIKFSADLETSKLDAAIKRSNANIKDWAKDFEKAGKSADQSISQLTNSFQAASRKQVGLIASLERALDVLKEKRRNAFTVEEIEKYNKKIQEAELTLKEYNEVGRQTVEVNDKTESGYQKISNSIVAWAAKVFTAIAVWKAFKGIIESTERTAEEFRATIAGAKAGLDYFMKSVATAGSGGFDGFIAGIKNAIRAGREFSKEQDQINNIRNEYAIKEADLNKEIEEQRRIFYEDEKTTNDEKLKAADKMLALMKQKSDMQVEIATKEYNAQVTFARHKNKLSEDEIRYAIEHYQRVEKIGGAYNRLKSIVDAYDKNVKMGLGDENYVDPFNTGAFLVTKERIEGTKKTMVELDPEAEKMGRVFAGLQRMTEKERKAIADGVVAVKDAENQFFLESKRIYAMRENMVDRQAEKEKDTLAKAWDAITESFKRALERRKQLQDQYDKLGYGKGTEGLGFTILDRATAGTKPTLALGKLAPFNQDVWDKKNEKAKKDLKDQEQLLEEQLRLRQEIVDAVGRVTYELAQQIGLDEQGQKALGDTLTMIQDALSGNLIGAAATMLSQLISLIPTHAKNFADEIEHINSLLAEQDRLIEKSERRGGQDKATEDKINLLTLQKDKLEAEIAKTTSKLQGFFGDIYAGLGGAKRLDSLKQQLADINIQIEETTQSLDDLFTGGLMETDIADVIETGIRDGASAGAEALDEVMKGALSEIFKKEVIGPEITATVQYLRDALKDKVFTNDEKAEFDKRIKEATENNKALFDNLMQGYDFGNPKGLTGAIQRQITEDTGSELAGLFRRFADDNRSIRDYSKLGIDHLMRIEANTFNTVAELQKVNTKLESVITNTKPVYSGAI